jgi:hypothetical protein
VIVMADRADRLEERRGAVKIRAVRSVRLEADRLTRVCLGLAATLPGIVASAHLHFHNDSILIETPPQEQMDLLDRL